MTTQNTGGSLQTTRRTLVKGAAWSVPVVAMGSAAPAMAASQDVTFDNLGQACKLPGGSCEAEVGIKFGYAVALRFCTNVRGTVTVDFGTATGTLCGEDRTWTVGPDPLTIVGSPDGSQRCEVINLGLSSTDSSNCPIAGSIPFTWMSSNGLSGSGTIFFSAPATPPCVNCEQPTPA